MSPIVFGQNMEITRIKIHYYKFNMLTMWTGIAQSVRRLAIGSKVRESKHDVREVSRISERPWGPSRLLYKGYGVIPEGIVAGA